MSEERMVKLRKDVEVMSQADEYKLRVNDWKVPYTTISITGCLEMLKMELKELEDALFKGGDILGEVVDCRNWLMFIAKNTDSLTLENVSKSEVEWWKRIPESKKLSPSRGRE